MFTNLTKQNMNGYGVGLKHKIRRYNFNLSLKKATYFPSIYIQTCNIYSFTNYKPVKFTLETHSSLSKYALDSIHINQAVWKWTFQTYPVRRA